jgi:DedD protein
MSEQTRYRLTGALFLIALAAILAPMLFDGDGLPKVEVKRLEPASARQPVQAPSGAFAQQTFDELEQQTTALRDEVDAEGFVEKDGASFGEVVLAEPEPDFSSESANEFSVGPSSEPDMPQTSQLARVWAIQVGSFARGDNAQALRDKLRSQGYEGFLSSAKRDGEVWTRVIVGPYLDKSEAQRVLGAIADKFSLSPELRAVVQ